MKRLSGIFLICLMSIVLIGCGKEREYIIDRGNGVQEKVGEDEYNEYMKSVGREQEEKNIQHDVEILSGLLSNIESAIALSKEKCTGGETDLSDLESITNRETVDAFLNLRSIEKISDLDLNFQSKAATESGAQIYVKVDTISGNITIYMADAVGEEPIAEELIVSVE